MGQRKKGCHFGLFSRKNELLREVFPQRDKVTKSRVFLGDKYPKKDIKNQPTLLPFSVFVNPDDFALVSLTLWVFRSFISNSPISSS